MAFVLLEQHMYKIICISAVSDIIKREHLRATTERLLSEYNLLLPCGSPYNMQKRSHRQGKVSQQKWSTRLRISAALVLPVGTSLVQPINKPHAVPIFNPEVRSMSSLTNTDGFWSVSSWLPRRLLYGWFHNREEPNVNPQWNLTLHSLKCKNTGGSEETPFGAQTMLCWARILI